MLAERMMQDTVSFATTDMAKAYHLHEKETMIDTIYRERMPYLLRSADIKCALAETLLLRYLEWMADHERCYNVYRDWSAQITPGASTTARPRQE